MRNEPTCVLPCFLSMRPVVSRWRPSSPLAFPLACFLAFLAIALLPSPFSRVRKPITIPRQGVGVPRFAGARGDCRQTKTLRSLVAYPRPASLKTSQHDFPVRDLARHIGRSDHLYDQVELGH